ncbi:hypothetical protein M758_UG090000 [Ceratodon purpureus]|nr:hypothetical protein M758_UG090000 [Ceratodon purpureus]
MQADEAFPKRGTVIRNLLSITTTGDLWLIQSTTETAETIEPYLDGDPRDSFLGTHAHAILLHFGGDRVHCEDSWREWVMSIARHITISGGPSSNALTHENDHRLLPCDHNPGTISHIQNMICD